MHALYIYIYIYYTPRTELYIGMLQYVGTQLFSRSKNLAISIAALSPVDLERRKETDGTVPADSLPVTFSLPTFFVFSCETLICAPTASERSWHHMMLGDSYGPGCRFWLETGVQVRMYEVSTSRRMH